MVSAKGNKIEERNDALKNNASIPLERYEWAIEKLKGCKSVLDIACGMGYGTQMLKNAGFDALGIDNSVDAINYARVRYNAKYELSEASQTTNTSQEAVVCLETLCHLDNLKDFLNNLGARYLVASAPIDPDPNDGYIYRKHNLSENDFKSLITSAGYTIIDELWQDDGTNKYLTVYAED